VLWASLSAELLARGFRRISYFELSCADHGDWRSAVEADSEFHPACPRCGRPSEATILAEGFSRRDRILPWECVSPALSAAAKRRGWDDAVVSPSKREYRTAVTRRPPNPRIVVIAWLTLRGASRKTRAATLGIPRANTLSVFEHRHSSAIEAAKERLQRLSDAERRTAFEAARAQVIRVTTYPQNFAEAQHSAS